jgi:hypothetical protein
MDTTTVIIFVIAILTIVALAFGASCGPWKRR